MEGATKGRNPGSRAVMASLVALFLTALVFVGSPGCGCGDSDPSPPPLERLRLGFEWKNFCVLSDTWLTFAFDDFTPGLDPVFTVPNPNPTYVPPLPVGGQERWTPFEVDVGAAPRGDCFVDVSCSCPQCTLAINCPYQDVCWAIRINYENDADDSRLQFKNFEIVKGAPLIWPRFAPSTPLWCCSTIEFEYDDTAPGHKITSLSDLRFELRNVGLGLKAYPPPGSLEPSVNPDEIPGSTYNWDPTTPDLWVWICVEHTSSVTPATLELWVVDWTSGTPVDLQGVELTFDWAGDKLRVISQGPNLPGVATTNNILWTFTPNAARCRCAGP